MEYKVGDIVEYEEMKLKLEERKYKNYMDCEGCALQFYFMKYCTRAVAKFGNFKFVKVED